MVWGLGPQGQGAPQSSPHHSTICTKVQGDTVSRGLHTFAIGKEEKLVIICCCWNPGPQIVLTSFLQSQVHNWKLFISLEKQLLMWGQSNLRSYIFILLAVNVNKRPWSLSLKSGRITTVFDEMDKPTMQCCWGVEKHELLLKRRTVLVVGIGICWSRIPKSSQFQFCRIQCWLLWILSKPIVTATNFKLIIEGDRNFRKATITSTGGALDFCFSYWCCPVSTAWCRKCEKPCERQIKQIISLRVMSVQIPAPRWSRDEIEVEFEVLGFIKLLWRIYRRSSGGSLSTSCNTQLICRLWGIGCQLCAWELQRIKRRKRRRSWVPAFGMRCRRAESIMACDEEELRRTSWS